ncbi:Uroporphyrinogen decarboxylase [Neomoorella glycerini]|uniref:Uroporphyrinogen decarboxylase n=1 Tax=Neomoorella glycerini TaxID=55779 RepID=A0A6I5ZQX6_9FIRM|nr:uroporphyrinogen decarboxylase family protein [Moorella glycerini]QGP91967.1 Uroporphyrinogen decarboxylase [Moorella glycerini]
MQTLTSLERCLAALRFEVPDRVPVVPQSFMVACATAGYKIGAINKSGRLMAETHLVSQAKYGYDGVVIDIDDATLAEACGAKVIWRENDVAIVDEEDVVLKDLRQIDDLPLPDPYSSGRLPEWLEATRILREKIGDHVFIMGRADQGPFDLACLLRGAQQFMIDLVTEPPELIWKVLDYCRRAGTLFAKAQKDAGAHATSIGDSFAGPNLISPAMFRQFALEHEITMTKEVQDYGIPFSIHICGDTTAILEDMASTGARILELDWQVDMGYAKRVVGNRAVLMGNINPSDPLVWGTPEAIEAQAKNIIEATGGIGLFLSSGCAMGYNTPAANMRALCEAGKKYGSYERLMELEEKRSKA